MGGAGALSIPDIPVLGVPVPQHIRAVLGDSKADVTAGGSPGFFKNQVHFHTSESVAAHMHVTSGSTFG